MAYDAPLLGAVTRLFVDSVLGWYQRHSRTSTRELAQSGAVVAVQRASSDSKLNPHLRAVFLDAVYVPGPDRTPSSTRGRPGLELSGNSCSYGGPLRPENGHFVISSALQ